LNIIIFTVYWLASSNILLSSRFAADIEDKFIMVPKNIVQGNMLYTLFTSMFMHATPLHLLGNMIFLYVFGDNVEDAFGHLSYLVFYIVCGVFAALANILSSIYIGDLTVGVLGASGAISGALGAYLVLYPRSKIVTLIFYFILPIPAIIFLGIWFAMQWFYGIFDIAGDIAYWAHIGGFITGMILALTVGRKRKKTRDTRSRL
jgi:membrane associated rhomboid family serine protease